MAAKKALNKPPASDKEESPPWADSDDEVETVSDLAHEEFVVSFFSSFSLSRLLTSLSRVWMLTAPFALLHQTVFQEEENFRFREGGCSCRNRLRSRVEQRAEGSREVSPLPLLSLFRFRFLLLDRQILTGFPPSFQENDPTYGPSKVHGPSGFSKREVSNEVDRRSSQGERRAARELVCCACSFGCIRYCSPDVNSVCCSISQQLLALGKLHSRLYLETNLASGYMTYNVKMDVAGLARTEGKDSLTKFKTWCEEKSGNPLVRL